MGQWEKLLTRYLEVLGLNSLGNFFFASLSFQAYYLSKQKAQIYLFGVEFSIPVASISFSKNK